MASITARLTWGLLPLLALSAAVPLAAAAAGSAASPLNVSLSGRYKGSTVSGTVEFATVMCAPLSGKGLQVNWNGSAKVGSKLEQVVGGMNFSTTGKSTLGGHGSATASLVVKGDYSGSLASGVAGGSGSATVAANRKSGSIDAVLAAGSSKVTVKGTWVCS